MLQSFIDNNELRKFDCITTIEQNHDKVNTNKP